MSLAAVACLVLNALAACSNAPDATVDPTATPGPAQSTLANDTTNAEPANCVRKSESFRYYDLSAGETLPRIEKFAPYPPPDMSVRYYVDTVDGKTVGIELPPRGKSPKGPVHLAVPSTPIVVGISVYGKRDRATVVVLPSGALADDYEWDLKYHADFNQAAEQASNAMFSGGLPSPIPTSSPDAERDRQFTIVGMPAVTALERGAGPDDRFFRDFTDLAGRPANDFDPHQRLFVCNYLEYKPYDLILTLVRKRRLADPQYGRLQAQLKEQRAPDSLINDAGYIAYEQDIFVARGVWPQLWPPDVAKKLDDRDVIKNAQLLPFDQLAKTDLPTPDATTAP